MTSLSPLVLLTLLAALAVLCSALILKFKRLKKTHKTLNENYSIQQVELERINIFKNIVESSPDLFLMVDQSLQVMTANKSAASFGWLPSHLFFEAQISDTSKLHFEFELRNVMETGNPTSGEIRLARQKDEKWLYYLYHIVPLKDESQNTIGATITALDITAQREAENELYRQREFLEGIMNAIPDPIYVRNDHLEWIYGNQAFSKLIGKTTSQYLGLKDEQVLNTQSSNLLRKYDSETLRTGVADENEEEILAPNSNYITVLTKRTPVVFHDGRRILITVMRDISDRKKLENELQISKASQQEASRLATLGETAGGIAHEINNPLNVLVGLAELMKATVEKKGTIEPQKLDEYCDRIVKYSMRIAKIVKGLRSISRDASQDPFSEVPLVQLVDEALELCQQQFVNRGIHLDIIKPEKELLIHGRYAQVSQIVINLLNNARDAIDGVPSAAIHLQVLSEGNKGIIRIWDTGSGVPQDIEHKIMNPFFTTKPVGKGTGLGLSISRAIAQQHGGTLRLNRQVSASCFELILPLQKTNILNQAS